MTQDQSPPDEWELPGDPLGLGPPRGGRRKAEPLQVEVVRSLVPDDLPALREGAAPVKTAVAIRHSHHQLAQLIASGVDQTEAGLITGYSPSYISTLVHDDPAFQELLAHYASVREEKFVDVMERMRTLGLSTLDELQERLEADTSGWTKRELMELAELMLVKPMRAAQGIPGNAPGPEFSTGRGVQVQVNFVQAAPQELKVIEGKVE